jgi:hypothetical protein
VESHDLPDQLQPERHRSESPRRDHDGDADTESAGERRRKEMREILLARIREKTQRQLRR